MTSSLPPVDSTQIPADVRKAGPEAEKLYAAALQFETVLTEQLAQAIQPSQDDESAGGDGTSSLYTQMLPQAFAQGVTGAGGLGLARDLYEALKK